METQSAAREEPTQAATSAAAHSVPSASRLDQPQAPERSSRDQIDQSAGQRSIQLSDFRSLGSVGKRRRREEGELTHASDEHFDVEAKVPGGRWPCVSIGKDSVVATDLHREPKLPLVRAIWQRRGDVVEGSQAHLVVGEQERVVLGVGIGARYEPVPDERIGEPSHGVVGDLRRHHPTQELGDVGWSWAALILVLARRWYPECLAEVFLMNPNDLASWCDAVVAVDDHG